MPMKKQIAKKQLPVRLDEETHSVVKMLAKSEGVAMSHFVNRAIRREIRRQGKLLEAELGEMLLKLRGYTAAQAEKDAEAFAAAEVEIDDPLRSTMAAENDPLGLLEAFAGTVE